MQTTLRVTAKLCLHYAERRRSYEHIRVLLPPPQEPPRHRHEVATIFYIDRIAVNNRIHDATYVAYGGGGG